MTHHLTEPRRRVGRLAGLWADTAWPELAGALTATGRIGAWRADGLIAAALIFIGLWAFAATLTYGICSESGIAPERTVRLSFAGTLLVVVLMGLLELFPVGGWLAAAVVAITSPVVTTWLVRRSPRGVAVWGRPDAEVRPDQPVVDRMFAQIVSELEDLRSSGPEPT